MIHAIEEALLNFTTDLYGAIGWGGVLVLMAVESAAIPFPSEIIMPLAGWKLILDQGHSEWYVLFAGLVGAAGNLLGSLIAYWAGALGGRPLLEKYGKYVLVTRRDLDRADTWFAKRGELTVFVTRLLPVVRTFISVPAGVARMNIWKFSAYTFAGAFIWSAGLAWGGYLLGENWEDLRSKGRAFDWPIIGAILLLAAWFVRHKVKELRAESRASKHIDHNPR
ncbi:MAG: DedA family protein [Dehalococcoidia bacterium]|nr:DedA family protein [Dehalococcoidia bacterium]